MKQHLNILMITSEADPFAKVGGLADVVGALPKALTERGHQVRVVMPRYYRIDRDLLGLKPTGGPLLVTMGVQGEQWCAVLTGSLPGTTIPVHFIEHEIYYGRDGLYQSQGGDHPDNAERFLFLSRAGLACCRMINFIPDVVHVHDWHTALVPVLLKSLYRHDPIFQQCVSLLTIHNLQHQGIFPKSFMDTIGIGWELFHSRALEYYDQVNCLKGGIYFADMINTVSPTYAREIQQAEFGYGLDGVIRDRAGDIRGILNGIDYRMWNPDDDPVIAAPFASEDLSGKGFCKRDLQRLAGLSEQDGAPLIGMVSRLVDQKGINLLARAIHDMLHLDIQMIILGTGEPWAHDFFEGVSRRHKNQFSFIASYNDLLARKIIAGADFFLIPSRFEPCGLTQMYAMRYGTLPIVRATGGLNDTVENFDETGGTGTGFKFMDLTPEALCGTIRWALEKVYRDEAMRKRIILNAMGKRFPWDDAAAQYEEIYRIALAKAERNRP